ncbi:MAG: type II secretion system F family protein [Solirubrobacteraceae bacterium MAG38_C4-C5]|nr:type II secretion system F family protein [Candidatus Siliceabacter maunaloa]
MNPLLPATASVACLALALAGVVAIRDKGPLWRFEDGAEDASQIRHGRVRGLLDALGARTGPLVLRVMGRSSRAKVRRRLDAAGRPGGMDVDAYAARKGTLFVITAFAAVLLLVQGAWFSALPLVALGWIGVDVWVDGVARRRQAAIERELPDLLDILAVCVGAGVAFRPALGRVGEAVGGPLGEEVETTLRQMTLGAPVREALAALRERNTSTSLGSFTTALMQAQEMGAPLVEALGDLAGEMRRTSLQRARQRAQRATPRVSLIVTLLIMPGAMLLAIAAIFLGANVGLGGLLDGG